VEIGEERGALPQQDILRRDGFLDLDDELSLSENGPAVSRFRACFPVFVVRKTAAFARARLDEYFVAVPDEFAGS